MAEIHRIGRWTAKAALEEALKNLTDDDAVLIIALSEKEKMMKYWCANCTNMQVNWMADNVKSELFSGKL